MSEYAPSPSELIEEYVKMSVNRSFVDSESVRLMVRRTLAKVWSEGQDDGGQMYCYGSKGNPYRDDPEAMDYREPDA